LKIKKCSSYYSLNHYLHYDKDQLKNKIITSLFHPVLRNLFINYLVNIDNKQYNKGFTDNQIIYSINYDKILMTFMDLFSTVDSVKSGVEFLD
jgi:hypothetical protein